MSDRNDTAVTAAWSRSRLLLRYARPERFRLMVLGVLLLVGAVLQVINPQIIRYYIDRTDNGVVSVLVMAAFWYLVVAVLTQVFRVAAAAVGESTAWSVTNALRVALTRHCLHMDIQFHKKHTPGELIERVDGDSSALANFMSSALLVILSNILLMVGVLVSMLITDWRIGLVLLCYALTAAVLLTKLRNIATAAWTEARQTSADLLGVLEERLSSTEDIRSNGAERHVLARLDDTNLRLLRAHRRARVRSNLIFLAMHGLYVVGYGGALALGGLLYMEGIATIGTVYLIVAYTNSVYTPLNEVRTQVQDLQQANAAADRVNELFARRPAIVDGPGAGLAAGPLEASFEEVTFRYPDSSEDTLHRVSFTLEPGTVLGLLGRTGSGKTTVTRLFARMYDPHTGTVRVGGADVRSARLEELRSRVGTVTQDVHLFHGTVRDNLTLFNEEIPDDEVLRAVQAVGMGEWLERLPDGLDTVMAAGGGGMSAGEAQILAISRVLLQDPGLVILDEVSSRLDPATEQRLHQALDVLLEGRTAIVIAHRPWTVDRADLVMTLDTGRVVEFGPRAELAADPRSRLSTVIATMNQEDEA